MEKSADLTAAWFVDTVPSGVALLPFVDERRLRAALEEVYPDLTPEESKLLQLNYTKSVCYVGSWEKFMENGSKN